MSELVSIALTCTESLLGSFQLQENLQLFLMESDPCQLSVGSLKLQCISDSKGLTGLPVETMSHINQVVKRKLPLNGSIDKITKVGLSILRC